MAAVKDTTSNAEALSTLSLLTVLETEEIVGAESTFVLTDELRGAVERGVKKTAENPGGWLKVSIPASIALADGSVSTPSDEECKAILSQREQDLRTASAQMGYAFRRQTPRANGKETAPRVMLYRISKRDSGKKSV